jgi:hypothetical protein
MQHQHTKTVYRKEKNNACEYQPYFRVTTDDRNDSMYDVNLNLVLVQIHSYDTRTLTPILIKKTVPLGLEGWGSNVKYRI